MKTRDVHFSYENRARGTHSEHGRDFLFRWGVGRKNFHEVNGDRDGNAFPAHKLFYLIIIII